MGLRINTNVTSLVAQHRLVGASAKLNTALERLSSGLRINRGADDVVGLLKSESLRSQIRGITVASSNITNARNLLGVAEGALAQLTDLAQRLRERALQGSDDTISTNDRANITTAMNDLLNEYSRIANATEFDGVKLIDGSFSNKTFQVGPRSGDTIAFSIDDARSSTVGQIALLTATTKTDRGSDSAALDLSASTGLVLNGITVSSTLLTDDGVSNVESDESAIAYVSAINSVAGQSGVQASVLANIVTFDMDTAGVDGLSSGTQLIINGITLSAMEITASDDSAMATFVTAVNAQTTRTGVIATYNSTDNTLVFSASDGRNIDFALATSVSSPDNVLGTGIGSTSGAMVYRGTFRLFADDAWTFLSSGNAVLDGNTAGSVSVSTATTLSSIDVASASNASTSVFILDNVIRQLQGRRTEVGSKTIRMEIAQSELDIRKENLADSESKIRDADVAEETANLTSAQILQQAGVQVLSRANAIPQIALTLLQA